MPNYFYVKSGGTCPTNSNAGMSATPRSGSFAAMGVANYYNTIQDAINAGKTTNRVAGDFIVVSNLHDHDYAALREYNRPEQTIWISVDDTDCQVYKRGATERATGNKIRLMGFANTGVTLIGLDFYCGTLEATDQRECHVTSIDCYFDMTETWQLSGGVAVATVWKSFDCDFNYQSSAITYCFLLGSAGRIEVYGGSWTGVGMVNLTALAGGAGAHAYFEGCDFSGIAGTPDPNGWLDFGQSAATDALVLDFRRCKFPPNITALCHPQPWGLKNYCSTVDISSCTNPFDSDNSDAYYFDYRQGYPGILETDLTEFLNATYDGSTGFSWQVSTHASTDSRLPFIVDLTTLPQVDMTSGITIDVEVISSIVLDDSQLWIRAVYSDETDLALAQAIDNRGELLNPSALTASTAAWNVGTGNKYKLSLTIPAQPAGTTKGIVRVQLFVAPLAAADINVDPAITVT